MTLIIRILLGLLLASSAHAAMVVDRIFINFSADGPPRQDVSIINPDEDPLYVQVEVLEVRHPGTEHEQREVIRDPESIGFIATPNRLTVPPGGRRTVRLVNLDGHGDKERVYRVNLNPVAAPFEADSTVIRVLVGYQLLVFVEPRQTLVDMKGYRDGKTLHLHNTGNVNIRLYNGKQCPAGASESQNDCVEVQGRRLYPGNQVEIALPLDEPVTFQRETAKQIDSRRFE